MTLWMRGWFVGLVWVLLACPAGAAPFDVTVKSSVTAPAGMEPAAFVPASALAKTPAASAPAASAGAQSLDHAAVSAPDPASGSASGTNSAASAQQSVTVCAVSDDNAYVRGNNARGADVYIENTHALLHTMTSSPMVPLFFNADVQALNRVLSAMDIRDAYLRVDERAHCTLLFTPAEPMPLETLLAEGRTAREILPVLGLTEEVFPPHIRTELDERLEPAQPGDDRVLGLRHLGVYIAHAGRQVLLSDHRPNVVEALNMLQEGVIPFSQDLKGDAPLRVCLRKALRVKEAATTPAAVDRFTFAATPAPGGWVLRFHIALAENPLEQTSARPVDLSDPLVCGNEPPFLLLGYGHNTLLTAWLDTLAAEGGPFAGRRAMLDKVDSVLLSLGGGQVVILPLCLPVATVYLKGDPEALQGLLDAVTAMLPGQAASVDGWDKVSLHSLLQTARIPANILLAQRSDILLGSLMDIQALSQSGQTARALLSAALDGSGLTLPKTVSGTVMFNVRQFFKEVKALLDDPGMSALIEMGMPGSLALLQEVCAATPPVTSVTGWLDHLDASRGVIYVTVSDEDSTPFWKSIKALSNLKQNRR